jgi:hypothetical protein
MTDKPTPMPDEMVRGMIENSNETLKAIKEIRGGDNLPIRYLVGLAPEGCPNPMVPILPSGEWGGMCIGEYEPQSTERTD